MSTASDNKTFESIMENVFNTKAEDAPPPPAATTPEASQPAPTTSNEQPLSAPPAQGGGVAPASTPAPTTSAPVTTPTTPPPAAIDQNILGALERLAQTQYATSNLLAQMQAAAAPKKETIVEDDRPPTVDEALADYRVPPRKQGESDDAFHLRVQAESLDHVRAKDRAWALKQAEKQAKAHVDAFRNEILQQQQAAAATQRYTAMLDETVKSQRFDVSSPQGQLARAYVDRTLTTLHQMGVTAQWGEQQWRQAATHLTQEFARVYPAPAAAAPNLTVIPGGQAPATAGPPISAGGSSSPVPTSPPNKQAGKPRSFDDVVKNVWDEMKKNSG